MKKLNKIFVAAISGLLLVGCNDLDTEPLGGTVTSDQKNEVYADAPEMLQASVTGIPATVNQFGIVLGDSYHSDFGYPALMLHMDTRGYDFVSENIGYNWFSSEVTYTDHIANGVYTYNVWANMYNQIKSANTVIKAVDVETQEPTLMYYLAQALAYRAFDYHVLAQLYQFNYVGNESKPCVPLILAENEDAVAAAGGAPRATVEEVYTQILSDINTAIALLEKTDKGISTDPRDAKKFISLAAARGIRARVYLTMQKWAEAAADAQWVIANSGATPYSIADVSKPCMSNAADNSWLWAVIVEEGDRVVTTGICNWPSHMGSLNYGYASVGAWRCVSKKLYNTIPSSDARKGWWLDENAKSKNLTNAQQNYMTSASAYPFTQVKFAPYGGEIYTSTNANDIPLMRIEEMYLILAEAQAMAGDPATGAATLKSFVSTYRDPSYAYAGGTKEAVQTEVYRQRRIELWGEGLSWFDIMRLGVGVDRRGAGFASPVCFNIAPNDPIMILLIPIDEVEANPNLGDNNPESSDPTPVADI